MSAGDPRQQARQHREFAGQQGFQHPALGSLQGRFEFRLLVADLPPNLVERLEAVAIDQRLRDRIHPLIAGGAVNAAKRTQLFMLAENLLDHHVEGFWRAALCLADQAAQALKVLRGIAQAVDMVETQALELSLRDQCFDEAMDGVERAGILDPQSSQRVDVEEATVIDIAGSQPPVAELVMLAFEQGMQRLRLRRVIRSCPIGVQPARDNFGASGNRSQLRLEVRRFRAVGMSQPLIAGGERENALAGGTVLSLGFLDDVAQDLAVALRRDRQPMLEIPGGKAAVLGIIAKLDL